jgi:hypothetical protein
MPERSRRLRQQTQTDEPALVEWQAPQATLRRIIPAVPLLLREFRPLAARNWRARAAA